MNRVLLELKNIAKSYGKGEARLEVLSDATVSVGSGELVALVAPSGAGKSTLLHIAGLLDQPSAGEVVVDGQPTHNLGDRARTQLRRTAIGFVYQFHHLLPEFTALENLVIPMLIAGHKEAAARVRGKELLDLLGVGARAEHRPTELSGGEQQRVAIARAAANKPHIILADEPTGNLDPATSGMVFDALVDLMRNQGSGTLFVTHDHSLARKADRVITLEGGRVVPATL
ncbi:MAG: ABC transporter ATP-binding protein [Hyphomicrobiaceae bacterium]|nr:ABC transporter ATP-binding protein [Hyphomicrobiaceae bacterium]